MFLYKYFAWLYIEVLFLITKTWKQPKHISTNEWIDNCDELHNEILYYLVIKRNKILVDEIIDEFQL